MSKNKIFVLDDEIDLTKMLKLNLEDTGNYEVEIINDSAKAIECMKEFQPDVALLDVMMPGIPGNEIADIIQHDEQLKHIKIIFLTAIVTKSQVPHETKVIGGRKFIAKPIKLDELIIVLEDELGQ